MKSTALRRHFPYFALTLSVLCGLAFFAPPADAAEKVAAKKLVIVGDSTAANGEDGQPARGWGQYLQPYFKDTIQVVNRALGGRSSKSFQREGHWKEVLDEKPDIVLIQFGHNDAISPDDSVRTVPNADFRDSIERYIETSRKIEAVPIIVTPMRMRVFKDGKVADALGPYADMLQAIARKRKVPVVDLFAVSTKLYEQLGKDRCEQFAAAPGDNIHFSETGAKVMADFVVRELRNLETPLRRELVPGFSILSRQ